MFGRRNGVVVDASLESTEAPAVKLTAQQQHQAAVLADFQTAAELLGTARAREEQACGLLEEAQGAVAVASERHKDASRVLRRVAEGAI